MVKFFSYLLSNPIHTEAPLTWRVENVAAHGGSWVAAHRDLAPGTGDRQTAGKWVSSIPKQRANTQGLKFTFSKEKMLFDFRHVPKIQSITYFIQTQDFVLYSQG